MMRSIALAPAFILPGTGLAVEDPVLARWTSEFGLLTDIEKCAQILRELLAGALGASNSFR
jgi:hypothetical protein